MEVEVMKANGGSAEASDWPMNCICNLCSCGTHSCASFAIEGSTNNTNRCRMAGFSSKKMNGLRGHEQGDANGELTESSGSAGGRSTGCQFDAGQRYLASGGKVSPGSKKRLESEQRDADLVHVLVTRPEIASKPRDNIVFEGDMDLRTTFETSYEALAKMRLDQWKRYQEATKGPGGGSQTKASRTNQRRQSSTRRPTLPGSPIVDHETDGSTPDDQPVEKQLKGVSNRSSADILEPANHKEQTHEIKGAKSRSETTPRSRTPFAVADTNSQNMIHDNTEWDYHYNLNQSSGAEVKNFGPNHSQMKVDRSQLSMGDRVETSAETIGGARRLAAADQPDIDPDLAPIIVYDANMNRLERVGMRKRSKYRPSTSLRSGPRGLFGDQVPERPEEENKTRDTGGRSSRSEDKSIQTEDKRKERKPEATSGTHPGEAQSRSGVSLRARNLKISSQTPDCLIYSERSHPVDSKRRIEDNVNMRDHIREQNIVDGGGRNASAYSDRVQDEQAVTSSRNGFFIPESGYDESGLERDLADIELAEREEAAANAEIQRVAASDSAPVGARSSSLMHCQPQLSASNSNPNSKAVSGGDGRGANKGETRASSRQSRLQRTCQEQSFHIGQNDYPANPIEKLSPTFEAKLKSSAMNSTHASPQSRVYNNLFSESPDFILTTGKPFMMDANDVGKQQSSSREDRFRYDAIEATSERDDSPRLVDHGDGSAADCCSRFATTDIELDQYRQYQTCDLGGAINDRGDCRVTKLDESYQYVGTRSGHKYFVEKIPETN